MARRTSLVYVEALGVHLKLENEQPIGAFKIRGAYNAIRKLPDAARKRGVITYSSGNHGQAVAYAAKQFGVRAVVTMPETAPAVKVAGVKKWGGEVVLRGPHVRGSPRQGRSAGRAGRTGDRAAVRSSRHRGGSGHGRARNRRAAAGGRNRGRARGRRRVDLGHRRGTGCRSEHGGRLGRRADRGAQTAPLARRGGSRPARADRRASPTA